MTDTEFDDWTKEDWSESEARSIGGESGIDVDPLLKELRAVLDASLWFEDRQSLLKKRISPVSAKLSECATRAARLRGLLQAYGVEDSAIMKEYQDKRRARDTTAQVDETEGDQ